MITSVKTIDIFCKVVDNYGDIGFAYRLARSLSSRLETAAIRLICDNLKTFSYLAPGLDPEASVQRHRGYTVLRWDDPDGRAAALLRRCPPRVLVECFSCGHPVWLDSLLLDPTAANPLLIISLEYLTSESWAKEYHKLPILSASSHIKKVFFMPGFDTGTAGLLLDKALGVKSDRAIVARDVGLDAPILDRFWVTIFGYRRDYQTLVEDLAAYDAENSIHVFLADALSRDPFLEAWGKAGQPFSVFRLPFMPQESWDRLIALSDFSLVRGEDSFARACLSGRPFLWQAYALADGAHRDKLNAFLARLRPFIDPELFNKLASLSMSYNAVNGDVLVSEDSFSGPVQSLLPLLRGYHVLRPAFAAFAASLRLNGDLADKLIAYIDEFDDLSM